MARRASSSVHLAAVPGVVVAVLVAIFGGYYVFEKIADPYRTIEPPDVGISKRAGFTQRASWQMRALID